MLTTEQFRKTLRADGLLAIVRGNDADACVRCVEVLADHGVRLVEISLTTTDALRAIERAAALGLDVLLGAGTLRSRADAEAVRSAGAVFAVTPARSSAEAAAAELDLPVLAGCFTPSEIARAHASGYIPKLFPAAAVGPTYVRALRDPFPDIDVVPVGGVDAEAAAAHLAAGALAVGVGAPLIGDAARGGDLDALAGRAVRLRRVVDEARPR
jgi:2-dehydro-3-deoxyphosphogluconate aldolase/(4S)-4-hydroxy-2-oxoglutarate aldolase